MHAVLRVDLQARVGAVLVAQDLVDAGRTVALLGGVVERQVVFDRDRRVLELEVHRLVFLVVRVGQENRGVAVEGDDPVGLGIVDPRHLGGRPQAGVIRMAVMQGPGRPAAEQLELRAAQQHAAPKPQLGEGGAEVARLAELLVDPGAAEFLGVRLEHAVALVARGEGLEQGLGGQHAALHGVVTALDLGHVEETRGAADEQAAGEDELGYGLQTALVERPRTVGDALAACQHGADLGMGLEALELVEGREVRVAVVEADHEADRGLIVLQVIDERAAPGFAVHRPAGGVQHQTRAVLGRIEPPEFLQADAVGLRVRALAEREAFHERLGQRSPAALGEQGVLGVQLHARLVAVLSRAVLGHPHVAGRHAADAAGIVIKHFGGGEAGVDLRAQALGLLGQPAADVAERDDVVAVVLELLRHQRDRHPERPLGGQKQELLLLDRGVERGALVLPVGDQLVERARIEDRAGEDVRAHLRAFLEHADRDLPAALHGQLAQPDRRRQAGRPGAHDRDVEIHGFAFHRLSPTGADAPSGRMGRPCGLYRSAAPLKPASFAPLFDGPAPLRGPNGLAPRRRR